MPPVPVAQPSSSRLAQSALEATFDMIFDKRSKILHRPSRQYQAEALTCFTPRGVTSPRPCRHSPAVDADLLLLVRHTFIEIMKFQVSACVSLGDAVTV